MTLQIRKLTTDVDEGLHHELARIEQADHYARDIVTAGAIPVLGEDWARVEQAVDVLSGREPSSEESEDGTREQWA